MICIRKRKASKNILSYQIKRGKDEKDVKSERRLIFLLLPEMYVKQSDEHRDTETVWGK